MTRYGIGIAIFSAIFVLTSPTRAAFISFSGETVERDGAGFGNVLTILVLHSAGGSPADRVQHGSILNDGQNDVRTGHATPVSRTRTIAELSAHGVNAGNFTLVLDLNQTNPHPTIDLHDFTLRFLSANGTTLFDAVFDSTDAANASTTGLAGLPGAPGHAFRVHFTPAEAAQLFGDPTNRIGMIITPAQAMRNTPSGGPDSFYITVPEPSSALLLTLAAAGLLHRRRVN